MNKINKTVKAWFANANEDLRVATILFSLSPEKYLRSIPYHSQQAAEKSIKGYLAYKEIPFSKTHDLGKLAGLILPVNHELSDLLKEADELTDYAIQFRYPDAASKKDPSIKEAEIALQIARKVYGTLATLIPFESPWEL